MPPSQVTRLRQVGSQFSLLLVAQILSAVLQALSMVLVARWDEPSVFGAFAASLALLSTVVAIGDLGLVTLVTRLRALGDAADGTKRALRAALWLTGGAGLFGFALVVCVFGQGEGLLTLILIAFYAVADRWMQSYLGVAIADGRTHINVLCLGASRGGLLLGVGCSSLLGVDAILAYGAFGGAASLASCVLAARLVGAISDNRDTKRTRELIRQARPFWIASGSYLVRTLDVSIVALVASPAAAALYAVPSRLTAPLRLLPATLNKMAIPYASRGDEQVLEALRRVMQGVLVVMACVLATGFIFATDLIRLTVGVQYIGATWPLRILLIGILLNVAGSFESGILQGTGQQRFVARLGVWLAVLCVVSVAVLGHLFSETGAAIAVSTIYLLQYVAVSLRVWRNKRAVEWTGH